MNKEEFLQTLQLTLTDFTTEERADILYDYEEHFRIGYENGKTDSELIAELGEPEDIAKQYKSASEKENHTNHNIEYKAEKLNVENVSISVIAAVSLLLFNLIFTLGIFLGLAGGLIGLFAGAIGAFLGGVALTFSPIIVPLTNAYSGLPSNFPFELSLLFGIGTIALGSLFFIGDCYLAKYFIKGTLGYIKWNVKIIRRSA